MRTTRRPFVLATSIPGLAILLLSLYACGGSGTPSGPTPGRLDTGEKAAVSAVNAALKSISSILARSLSQTGTTQASGAEELRASGAAEAAAADSATCDTVTIQYFNVTGVQQPFYNPITTARITAKGSCTVSGVPTSVDLTFDEVQASSSSVLVNGTTVSTYEGITVTATTRNLRVPKQSCAIPTSGEISARVQEVTMTIGFNGSSTVTATYSRGSVEFSFQVPVTAC